MGSPNSAYQPVRVPTVPAWGPLRYTARSLKAALALERLNTGAKDA